MWAYSTEQMDPQHNLGYKYTVGCGCALDTGHLPHTGQDKDPDTCG